MVFVVGVLSSTNAAPPQLGPSLPGPKYDNPAIKLAFLDLKVWTTSLSQGGKTVHIKNIGTKKLTGTFFHGVFRAKKSGPNSNDCFERNITKLVPAPGQKVTKNITGTEIANTLGTSPTGYEVRINDAHNPVELTYTNNKEGNFNSVTWCN